MIVTARRTSNEVVWLYVILLISKLNRGCVHSDAELYGLYEIFASVKPPIQEFRWKYTQRLFERHSSNYKVDNYLGNYIVEVNTYKHSNTST
jgi:hypothetical protein